MSKKIISLLASGGEDNGFILLIQDYLYTLSKPGYHEIKTSGDLDYHINFISAIHKLVIENPGPDLSLKLFRELIYLNFNCLPVIWFYIDRIQKDYDQIDFYQEELVNTIVDLRNLQRPEGVFEKFPARGKLHFVEGTGSNFYLIDGGMSINLM
ncbi:MAG: hypothetical protein ACHQIM_21475 [Sphingobacteriales bacterium]